LVDAQLLPRGRTQAGDHHLKFYETRDNLGNGSGGSSATYSGADLAASLKQGAVQQGYAADKVTATCGTAPKRAGAVSDCTVTRNGIANDIRVTYSDD